MAIGLTRKTPKKLQRFTVMAVGGAGLGKTTFLATMFPGNIIPRREMPLDSEEADEAPFAATEQTEINQFEYEDSTSRSVLEIVDTPGFDEDTDTDKWITGISSFIENRYQEVLEEEQRVKRNPHVEDHRVHALLYFISPNTGGLSDVDIRILQTLGPLVNIIPIAAKADSFTPEELFQFRRKISDDIKENSLSIFGFSCDDDETHAYSDDQLALKECLPFAIIGATTTRDGRRGREYGWGFAETDNPDHSDTLLLFQILLQDRKQDLKDMTEDYLYENYRTENLSKSKANKV
eukprot:GHVP01005707.1.p1 GENE.GHVP01005707.1~~GHVP01005707.1.p1  ORF type:complete len:293 (-),score=59.11 GHVP01005707.1:901-1779(-)